MLRTRVKPARQCSCRNPHQLWTIHLAIRPRLQGELPTLAITSPRLATGCWCLPLEVQAPYKVCEYPKPMAGQTYTSANPH
jgi:hypothetical protein